MNIAIYSRKSKFTGTGDSIDNQIQMCKDHLAYIYKNQDYTIQVFEDEGFTGKNTNRPMFQSLLCDIQQNKVNVLICYRLDRLSRSVSDFSQLLDTLQKHGVVFISVSENFDTSSPMGRAMINIASVFAQLERETIAERVKDNKIQIAKTGRWQGGLPPVGFVAEKQIGNEKNGKTRSYFYLKDNKGSIEYETAMLIFDLYKKYKSIIKIEQLLLLDGVHTPQGNEYTTSVLKNILINPVYAKNDPCLFDFFEQNGCEMASDKSKFDGKYGLVGYGKTADFSGKRLRAGRDNWIISVGQHQGLISGEDFITIQKNITERAAKFPRYHTSQVAQFSGLIKCSCGAPMLVKGNRPDKHGNPSYYYKCMRKHKSLGTHCNVANIKGPFFDEIVINKIKSFLSSNGEIEVDVAENIKQLTQSKKQLQTKIKDAQKQIEEKDNSIKALVVRLANLNTPQNVLIHIENTISSISKELDDLKNQIIFYRKQIDNYDSDFDNLSIITSKIKEFSEKCDTATVPERREMLKNIIKCINWDGDNFEIILFTDKITGG